MVVVVAVIKLKMAVQEDLEEEEDVVFHQEVQLVDYQQKLLVMEILEVVQEVL